MSDVMRSPFELKAEYEWKNALTEKVCPVSEQQLDAAKKAIVSMKEMKVAPIEVYLLQNSEGMWIVPANINEHPFHMPIMKVVNRNV